MIRQIINEETIENIIGNNFAKKPKANAGRSYPYNELDDRVFEILLFQVFKKKIETEKSISKEFDGIDLMQGVGEKGMDCILYRNGKSYGLIQCKKYSSNLNIEKVTKEILKFGINYICDESLIYDIDDFTYYISVSKGFTGQTAKFLQDFNSAVFKIEQQIKEWSCKIIKTYSSFKGVDFADNKEKLYGFLRKVKIRKVIPEDLDIELGKFQDLIENFFSVKSVVSMAEFKRLSKKIEKKIDSALSKKFDEINIEGIDSILTEYSKAAIEKLDIVNFIGFDLHRHRQKPDEVTLTKLFVPPSFIHQQKQSDYQKSEKSKATLRIPSVFNSDRHIVLLGDPGAGKSLLVKYIIVKILQKNSEDIGLKNFSSYIPFRIELRKLNEEINKKSIIVYLRELLAKEYQIVIDEKSLAYIIQNKHTLFFFDGLDEIFTPSHKVKVKVAIEQFLTLNPNVKGVVTSRFIGYHDVKFKSEKFNEYAIQKFSDEQQKVLIERFYTTQIVNKNRRKETILSCGKQISELNQELTSNPLILTLVLILYLNSHAIPESKLEIYESCTNTLVDSLDLNAKGLRIELPIEDKRRTFGNLGFWQYQCMSNNEVVSYQKAVDITKRYLIEKNEFLADHEGKAEKAAEKFLEYAERRSIYFDNNFTHKTFLEYYTADFLFIKYYNSKRDLDGLNRIIAKYVVNPFWNIVFELLFLKIDKDQEDTDVLDEIFRKQMKNPNYNLIYLLTQNLIYIKHISEGTKRQIIKEGFNYCISNAKSSKRSSGIIHNGIENSVFTFLSKTLNHPRLYPILKNVFYEFEDEYKKKEDLVLLYSLHYDFSESGYKEEKDFFKVSNQEQLDAVALTDPYLYISRFNKNLEIRDMKLFMSKQIQCFGVNDLFEYHKYSFVFNLVKIPSYHYYLLLAIEKGAIDVLEDDFYQLEVLGLNVNLIVKKLKESKTYYFIRGENLEKIIKAYVKAKDKNIELILFEILKLSKENITLYRKIRETIPSNKYKELDKLFLS